ncbi:MAG: hypothetical protein PHS59_15815 [Paludibacter sp.]|nr:hypothetical protein [Paludibacter sp.]
MTSKIIVTIALLVCIVSPSFAKKKVMLDNYYNNETNKKTNLPYHYLWDDKALSGFSELGDLFVSKGAKLATLTEKPTTSKLRCANIFIIVDPDTPAETAKPNFMDTEAAKDIAKWVKRGGTLVVFTNDVGNSDLDSINLLTEIFGIKYNKVLLHPELKAEKGQPRNYDSCNFTELSNHPLFFGVKKIFMKETSSITCSKTAIPILTQNGDVYMAQAKYGRGFVFAVTDPWLYNEYIDHAHLPADFENLKAARNLVDWLLGKK